MYYQSNRGGGGNKIRKEEKGGKKDTSSSYVQETTIYSMGKKTPHLFALINDINEGYTRYPGLTEGGNITSQDPYFVISFNSWIQILCLQSLRQMVYFSATVSSGYE